MAMQNVARISQDSKRNINQINNIKISSICLKYMNKHAKINFMFSHETARGTVGLTPNKYTYIFTCTLYSVLFELVPTSAENIQFKSFRVANLS